MGTEEFKEILLQNFLQEVKCSTSWGKVENLESTLENYGYTGIFSNFLGKVSMDELKDVLTENWNRK